MDIPTLPSKCPGFNLYIDGFTALRRPKELQASNITHIVSAVDWNFPENSPLIRGFQHLHVPLDDVYDSNILEYFPRSNAFIHQGLNYWPANQATGSDGANTLDHATKNPRQSGVLVHCAMGISRSATIVIAYLLWHSRQSLSMQASSKASEAEMVPLPPTPLSVDSALALLREGRPRVEPNSGFIKQLRMYVEMGCPTTQSELENHKIYRRWMNSRNVMDALSVNRAPELDHITWRDEEEEDEEEDDDEGEDANGPEAEKQRRRKQAKEDHPDPEITDPMISTSEPAPSATNTTATIPAEIEIKCRKCRRLIAKSSFIIRHQPPAHRDPTSSEACAHIFLHPLSWMKSALGEGTLDGRLTCPNPRCGANIGKFAWQGLRCSCGGWVTPGFGVGRGKVDEVPVRKGAGPATAIRGAATSGNAAGGGTVGALVDATSGLSLQSQQQHHQHHPAVRLPPGMRRAASGNL